MEAEVRKRALLVTRLSMVTDVTTSPERQKETTEHTAALKGFSVAGYADDLDVSASKVAPMDRKKLGDWLKNRADEFDVIVFWRLDRFVRKVSDLAKMIEWCDEHGKDLVSATEPFELSSPMGRAMAYLIGVFAEMESNAIRERVTSFKAFARTRRRWGGGPVPYGYRLVDNPEPDEGGKVAVEDATAAEIVREIFTRIASGDSARQLEVDLNTRGLPSPLTYRRLRRARQAADNNTTGELADGVEEDEEAVRPIAWQVTTITNMIKAAWPLGRKEFHGKVVRDTDGEPVLFGPALVSFELWQQANSVLKSATRPKKRRHGGLLLSGIVRCIWCELPLTSHHAAYRDTFIAYYRCTSAVRRRPCPARLIRADKLDPAFEDAFLDQFGTVEIVNRVWVEGSDASTRIAEIGARLAELREDRTAGLYSSDEDTAWYRQQVKALESERKRLQAGPGVVTSRWEEQATGVTYADAWNDADLQQRRNLLMEHGFRGFVWRDPFTVAVFSDAENDSERQHLATIRATIAAGQTDMEDANADR